MQLTIDDLKELIRDTPTSTDPWVVGEWYLVRTVTMINIGRLEYVGPRELVLGEATWIPSTGRWHDMLKDPGVIDEAEPWIEDCIIGRGAIVDATRWNQPGRISQR